jgi:hypothetical protein
MHVDMTLKMLQHDGERITTWTTDRQPILFDSLLPATNLAVVSADFPGQQVFRRRSLVSGSRLQSVSKCALVPSCTKLNSAIPDM